MKKILVTGANGFVGKNITKLLNNKEFEVKTTDLVGSVDYIGDLKNTEMLESATLNKLAIDGELVANKHTGYWKCIDTARDLDSVKKDILVQEAGWMVWK